VPQATAALQAAGFTNLSGSCTVDPNAPNNGMVTGTNPPAQTVTNRGTAIAISFNAKAC
jgi:beta-lactam-binding protein with PASTA domain